jgi:SWI/SNF-related matrix-associated actin-dependent regulator of chromatin subfamily A3
MNESVEERVLEIQAEKRSMVSLAFKEKAKGQRATESRSADVKKLLYGASG